MTAAPASLHGGCHCGKITVALSTSRLPGDVHPRACDCAFCMKHGAGWVSDPEGRLAVDLDADATGGYRQGSGSARFLLCRDCGVLVAVVHGHDDDMRGAVNVRCLDDAATFGDAATVSPHQLSRDEKIARWSTLWTPTSLHVRT